VQNLHRCYLTLGVSEDATKDETIKAFRDLARRYHPDKSAGGSSADEEQMKEINGAFKTLSATWKLEIEDGKGGKSARGRGAAGVGINRSRLGCGAYSPGNSTATASPSSSATRTPDSLSHSPEL
jgi:DnaJ-class molecular chaperone